MISAAQGARGGAWAKAHVFYECARRILADFTSTHFVQLSGVVMSDGTMTWTGETSVHREQTIVDVGGDGILSEGVETYFNNSKFSGYYITVGGQHFGIFTVGSFGLIPYDENELSLGHSGALVPEVTARNTSLHTPALHGSANCFLTGTRIATPQGLRAIETLGPDDLVLTADGRVVPIIWVWRQEIVNIQVLSEALTPIVISAGAFGPDRPLRDLIVTADHAVMLDGLLINAGALVNGDTIRRLTTDQMPARYCYWHIETAAHEVLLAENCPTESYVDYALRQGFDNYDAYLARYGHARPIAEMVLPRISAARLVPAHLRVAAKARSLA